MEVAVVILNWNGRHHLETYLPSVVRYSSEDARIILADNASTDDSVEFVKSNYPNIEIVQNKSNGGFAKGYNDALKHVKADLYVLLNSDVEVTKNWIKPFVEAFQKDENLAAAQPKILSYLEKNKFEHAGACGGFIDKFRFPFCRGRIFETAEDDSGQYDNSENIFWATGACLFIRSSDFHAMNGFDSDFFAHMEEIDLCWRLQRHGKTIQCLPGSIVYHLGGGTLQYLSPRKTFLNFRNNLFMIHKNESGILFIKIIRRLMLDGIAGMLFVIKGQFSHFIAVLKAHFSYYGKIPTMNKKRKALKKTVLPNPTLHGVLSKSVVWAYFGQKKKTFKEIMKS